MIARLRATIRSRARSPISPRHLCLLYGSIWSDRGRPRLPATMSLTRSMTLATIKGMTSSRTSAFDETHHRGDEPHLLREVLRTYQVLMAGFSRQTGMPASRFMLMRLVALAEGDVGVMDLARQLGVNASAVTRQVQELEQDQLLRRSADARDGRRRYVRLSPKGRKVFEAIHERTHELERSLASVIGAEELRGAAIVLAKLRAFVEGLR